jgi:hypothetical protein
MFSSDSSFLRVSAFKKSSTTSIHVSADDSILFEHGAAKNLLLNLILLVPWQSFLIWTVLEEGPTVILMKHFALASGLYSSEWSLWGQTSESVGRTNLHGNLQSKKHTG